jgi:hypothetical protein
MSTLYCDDDSFFEEKELVFTETVVKIPSTPSHVISSIPLQDRNTIVTYISDKIYDEVTNPLRYNKSDASVNAHTMCDIRENVEMSHEDARIIMQTYLSVYFPAYAMTILPKLNYKHASVQKAIRNKRAYTDIRNLIFAELKANLKHMYSVIKEEKKEAAKQARIEAEAAEERRIQQLRQENQQKKEAEKKAAEEEALRNRLKSIVLDIADDEWD